MLDSMIISGKETLPIIEGGKGIAVSSGESSGAWAKAGGVGTFSGVNADSYDNNGNLIPQIYKEKTRSGRHRELIEFSVSGAVEQAKIASKYAEAIVKRDEIFLAKYQLTEPGVCFFFIDFQK